MGRKAKTNSLRPICSKCNINLCRKGNKNKLNIQLWGKYCNTCHKAVYNLTNGNRSKGYVLHKKDFCEFCGFIPIDLCQLDVDHIDGDRTNNAIENLQTLCANCHRLKTKLQSKRDLS